MCPTIAHAAKTRAQEAVSVSDNLIWRSHTVRLKFCMLYEWQNSKIIDHLFESNYGLGIDYHYQIKKCQLMHKILMR